MIDDYATKYQFDLLYDASAKYHWRQGWRNSENCIVLDPSASVYATMNKCSSLGIHPMFVQTDARIEGLTDYYTRLYLVFFYPEDLVMYKLRYC